MGWQELWKDPEVRQRWEQFPPLPQVVEMADRLQAEGRRRVLDIGCGLGRHTVYLASRGYLVTGIDYSPVALTECHKHLDLAGLQATLLEVDMTTLPFPSASFDAVVAAHVIHHVDGPTLRHITEAVTGVLTTEGWLVWATPSTRHYRCGRGREIDEGTWVDDDHWEGPVPHHYSSEAEIRELLKAYWIESIEEHEFRENEHSQFHWRVLARKCR